MFRNYSGLWLLLSAALVIMLVVAFSDDITVGDYTLKKAPVADMLLKSDVASEVADSVALDSVRNAAKEVVTVTDSLPQSLFIFGDSMTYNLALRLAQYAKQNGHSIHAVNWDSSNTKIWADCDTLSNMIRRFRPTHVFIALGSNELYFKDPKMRLPHIRKILEMIDTVPYTWIGPPNWQEDTGLNDVIESVCKPGSFFRSAGMHFERKADHIHPTRASSALWMDSIMRWIPKSSHPFVVNVPSDSIGKANPHIIFLKALNK